MESREKEYSYFLHCKNEMEAESLQSVANVYFDARAVDEDEDSDETYSDYSDDSADNRTDGYSGRLYLRLQWMMRNLSQFLSEDLSPVYHR